MEIGLHLEQTQKLIITPELRQAIEILQLSTTDLLEFSSQALAENPLLETSEPEDTAGKETSKRIDWELFVSKSRDYSEIRGLPREMREDGPHESMLTNRVTLEEHLLSQWRFMSLRPAIRRIGEYFIGNLNSSGYLAITPEQAAADLGCERALALEALRQLQSLEPVGVCAQDLRQCLLLQVEHLILEQTDKELLRQIIIHHLEDIGRGGLVRIAKAMALTPAAVQTLVDRIRRLNPKPGVGFAGTEETVYIVPDVVVERQGEDFRVVLSENFLPRITINETYTKVLMGQSQEDRAAKAYVETKLNQAAWLMRCLEQRRSTIHKVTEALIKYQRDFFLRGVSGLRPLTMRQIADDVGVHESTISRAAANKYIQTPHGVYEFKFFFMPGLESADKGSVSTESIRETIREMIRGENPAKPYTDQQIADMLGNQGTRIARRTVAKYREELNIRSTALRRRY
ncbi:MAG: RNA polymerase factor sigma-54 [Peptococcaceae bacterium]|jgi:RNA polymerase sigma-54 factor|nr:RNA polymerase factor sigma-54 [Peptococcaceae bacterium]